MPHHVNHAKGAEAEEIAKTIFEAIADPVFVIELEEDGLAPHFFYVNEATCRTVGYPREELIAMPPGTVDDIDPAVMETTFEKLIKVGEAEFEAFLVSRARTRIPVEIHAKVARLAGRTFCVGVARSLAAHKEMEKRAQEAREAAEAANRAKSEFLAMMSHEIRTPLHGVIGFTSLLEDMDGLPERTREALEGIHSSSNLLLTLVSDVLDFSRIEMGQISLRPEPVDLGSRLSRLQAAFKLRAEQKGLTFHYTAAPDLAPRVVVDCLRVEQIVGNLLGNALKFTDTGSITLEVRQDTDRRKIFFVVTDTGIGIRQDQMPRLFKPFSQADPLLFQKYGGSGLGLAIVRRLCELMGGNVSVESTFGRGSTFTASVLAPPTQEGPDSLPSASRPSGLPENLRILVAEDNPVNRKLMGRMLDRLGYTARLAVDGREALILSRQTDFDIILMDVSMPMLNGLDATRAIRAEEARMGRTSSRIIALTAGISEPERKACAESGMDDFLGKPFTIDSLRTILEKAAAGAACR
jgi:PAS domain S-box-containing protein